MNFQGTASDTRSLSEIADTRREGPIDPPTTARISPRHEGAERAFSELSRELRCTLDAEGRVLTASGAWERILGRRPEELTDRALRDFVHPADRTRLARAFDRLGASATRELEIRMSHASDGYRVISWDAMCADAHDRVLAVGLDCTQDRRRFDRDRRAKLRLRHRGEALSAELEALREHYREVERFAAVAAHQLSEPLIIAESSLIMISEELGDRVDPTFHSRIDAVGKSAARARRLIDSLLQDARAAGAPLELRPVDMSRVVEDAICELEARIEERGITPIVAPLPTIDSEPGLLSVVLQNLISNALKYGPRHGEVRVGAEREASGWSFTVASGGSPISQEQMARIFQPFRRVPGERRAPGTGLGLAICARLVERLGGTLGVRPGEHEGNVFYFVLPDSV